MEIDFTSIRDIVSLIVAISMFVFASKIEKFRATLKPFMVGDHLIQLELNRKVLKLYISTKEMAGWMDLYGQRRSKKQNDLRVTVCGEFVDTLRFLNVDFEQGRWVFFYEYNTPTLEECVKYTIEADINIYDINKKLKKSKKLKKKVEFVESFY